MKNNQTPETLINELSFKTRYFDKENGLTEFIHKTSRIFMIPLSSLISGSSRKYQIYVCRYGGRQYGISTAKTDCPCFVKYQQNKDGSYSFFTANWSHNHSIDRMYIETHCNCCSDEIKTEIEKQTSMLISPGQIRSNLDVISPPDIFYNMRRNMIKAQKKENIFQIINELKLKDFSSIIGKNEQGTLTRATVMNLRVAQNCYSEDILITDDTASTNIYDMKLQVLLAIDEESKSQVYAFGYLAGQDKNSFKNFFDDVRKLSNKIPRVIIMDRCQAQYAAVSEVFPETFVVFCLRHLGKDLEKYFDKNSDIIIGFYDIQKRVERCDDYINMLMELNENMDEKTKGKKIINWMLDYQNNWLPIKLIENGVIFDWTTNRAEGFFGIFKQRFGFKRFTLSSLTKNMIIQCRTLIVDSNHSIKNTNTQYSMLPSIKEEDIPKIGLLAIKIIAKETIAMLNGKNSCKLCKMCIMRNNYPELALPCRHIMSFDYSISSRDLHPRYLRNDFDLILNANHNVIETNDVTWSNSYSDIMSQLSPFASIAYRNEDVNKIFQDTIEKLKSMQESPCEGMPARVGLKGKLSVHPAKNVILGGREKSKRVYKCKYCNANGHNVRSCPKLINAHNDETTENFENNK